jgi:hypothetical protein
MKDTSVVVDKLLGGDYTLVISSERGTGTAKVALAPGATQSVEVSLSAWGVVRGTLVGADGRPLGEHQITAIKNGGAVAWGDSYSATTDRDGRFVLQRVDPRSDFLLVNARDGGITALPLQVSPGQLGELGTVTVRFDAKVSHQNGR